MADKIIQNPSITPNDFGYDGGAISSILGAPLVGAGGGTIIESDFVWLPSVTEEGVISWQRATSATTPSTANIMGPKGADGTNGAKGEDGKDGISPTFTITPTASGTHVVLSGAQGEASFDVLSGAKGADGKNGQNGAPGADGISPTFTTSVTSDEQHPQGGTHVVISGAAGENAFNVWNGVDGEGATVDLLEGNGIQITHEAGTTNYTISVSADYATKTYANDASANALSEAKTWVGDQGFLKNTDLTDYATKTYADTASAEALSQAKTWVEEQSYLPTSGGTVSGKLTVSGSDFDNSLEIIRGGSDTSASTGQIGINGAGGLSFKIKRGNNNTQLNIAPNATMDKRFSIGDSPYSPAAYLIPAVTATTTAGLTDDGILHIIVEN